MARSPSPGLLNQVHAWLDERIELGWLWRILFKRLIPKGVGLWYTLGFASLFLFVNQAFTGALLAMYYSPAPDHAYDSILFIMNQVTLGSVIRGLHYWGASAMVVLLLLHGIVVFVLGSYKYPRELTWVIGVLMLLVVLGFSFTGYLLPWDEKAYWAITVGTNMAGTVPYMGDAVLRAVRGGTELGAVTLVRFYALHTMVLPVALGLLLGIHLFLVVKQGVSVPPRLWEKEQVPSPARGEEG